MVRLPGFSHDAAKLYREPGRDRSKIQPCTASMRLSPGIPINRGSEQMIYMHGKCWKDERAGREEEVLSKFHIHSLLSFLNRLALDLSLCCGNSV